MRGHDGVTSTGRSSTTPARGGSIPCRQETHRGRVSTSAPPAIGWDALLGNPHAIGRRAVLPEHVDGDAPARIPIAADPKPSGIGQLDDTLADRDGRVLVEGAHIAEAREIELERF